MLAHYNWFLNSSSSSFQYIVNLEPSSHEIPKRRSIQGIFMRLPAEVSSLFLPPRLLFSLCFFRFDLWSTRLRTVANWYSLE